MYTATNKKIEQRSLSQPLFHTWCTRRRIAEGDENKAYFTLARIIKLVELGSPLKG